MHDEDSPEDGWDVFISFATEDQRYAEELKERLDEQGWKVFLAHESVRQGARWRQRIPRALLSSQLVAVLLSERSARARYQDSEIVRAIEAEERGELEITPIYLEGKPDGIRGWDFGLEGYQSLDLSRLSMGEVGERLGGRLVELGAQGKRGSSQPIPVAPEGRGGRQLVPLLLALLAFAAVLSWGTRRPTLSERSWWRAEKTKVAESDETVPVAEDRLRILGIEMVQIPGGSFQMGDPDSSFVDERPMHSVKVASFQISKTEVTVAQYRPCVEAGKCLIPDESSFGFLSECAWNAEGNDNHPINCVSWDDAMTYAEWIGARLPTEAEWEYAARGGGLNRDYPWGDKEPTCKRAVIKGCGSGTEPVCSKADGNAEQGLCDMGGNVWEWVEDDWHDNYVGAPENGSAWIDSPRASKRVYRGGSWRNTPLFTRVAKRSREEFSYRYDVLGFRLAKSLPPPTGDGRQ